MTVRYSFHLKEYGYGHSVQGPPLAGRYDMGAICMQEHADKLQNLVNDALEKGAEIAGRGSFGHLGEDAVDQFFPPTVLVNVDHTMRLMQEEVAEEFTKF